MLPLQRPGSISSSRPSTLSWWSDSNTVGPTISLHAAAKPLMHLLHLQQARALIAARAGTDLDQRTMETYAIYLSYKYSSTATRTEVLADLSARAWSPLDSAIALELFSANGAALVATLLAFSAPQVRRLTLDILAKWAANAELRGSVRGICPPELVDELSCNRDNDVRKSASYLRRQLAAPISAHIRKNITDSDLADEKRLLKLMNQELCVVSIDAEETATCRNARGTLISIPVSYLNLRTHRESRLWVNTTSSDTLLTPARERIARYIYWRHARNLLKDAHGGQLTSEMLETCASYLAYDYVSTDLKVSIMKHLVFECETGHESDRIRIAEIFLQYSDYLVWGLLESPSALLRTLICKLLVTWLADRSPRVRLPLLPLCELILPLLTESTHDSSKQARTAAQDAVVAVKKHFQGRRVVARDPMNVRLRTPPSPEELHIHEQHPDWERTGLFAVRRDYPGPMTHRVVPHYRSLHAVDDDLEQARVQPPATSYDGESDSEEE
ncbi:hypothetical protein MKEN_00972400 [Mycena kentingensis (nom. inval.)]|nr:hypothetical protein MKEN_00972400 [Mycena kentingensis (nom. inval.)]